MGALFSVNHESEWIGMRCTGCRKITRFRFHEIRATETAPHCRRCDYDGFRLRWDHARKVLNA